MCAELIIGADRALRMHYVEEMTLKEIGMLLGLRESGLAQIRTAMPQLLRERLGSDAKWQRA